MIKNRKNLGLKGLALIAGVSLFGAGCSTQPQVERESPKAVTIKISEGEWVYGINRYIAYRGKIGQDTFLLSSSGPSDVDTFYPANAKTIYFKGKNYQVEDLTTQSITLRPTD